MCIRLVLNLRIYYVLTAGGDPPPMLAGEFHDECTRVPAAKRGDPLSWLCRGGICFLSTGGQAIPSEKYTSSPTQWSCVTLSPVRMYIIHTYACMI